MPASSRTWLFPFLFPGGPGPGDRAGRGGQVDPAGVVSGVYYVRVPACVRDGKAGEAGFIRFGHPLIGIAGGKTTEALTAAIRPEEGMMVLFPSYFWHYTVPYESDEERISIAFDAIPKGGAAEPDAY